jgi:16S rRNA (guanine(966)-N(2))-methyltransferase RsmD
MRIIAGKYKGTRLYTPKNKNIRPTTDRVREFLFSCIGQQINHARILDLFSGTGSFGIEAMSRGACHITFVDRSIKSVNLIKRNLEKVDLTADIHRRDVFSFLKTKQNLIYDIIFCDPPYNFNFYEKLFDMIYTHNNNPGLMLIIESSKSINFKPFEIKKQKNFGNTQITFLMYVGT